jgi:hypothetical protein
MRIIKSLRSNGVIGVTFPNDQKTKEATGMTNDIGCNKTCNIDNMTDYAVKVGHHITL